jgi:hypothetical protein
VSQIARLGMAPYRFLIKELMPIKPQNAPMLEFKITSYMSQYFNRRSLGKAMHQQSKTCKKCEGFVFGEFDFSAFSWSDAAIESKIRLRRIGRSKIPSNSAISVKQTL